MKKLVALLLAILMVVPMVAFADNAEGQQLVCAIGAQFTTLDPTINNEVVNGYALDNMYEGLFKVDTTGAPTYAMCESYECSDDGLVYTFKIKEGVMWSDGQPVTANDFVYGWLRGMSFGPDNAYALYNMLKYVKGASEYNAKALEVGNDFDCTVEDYSDVGVKALDDYTFEVTLKVSCPYFTKLLTGSLYYPMRADVAPQHDGLWALEGGYPTNGPFTLAGINENEYAELVKNPNYYDVDKVKLDSIYLQVMPDPAAQLMAFQTGEIDLAYSVSGDTAQLYDGKDELMSVPAVSNYFLAINSGNAGPEWAKNVNLRKALALAIDKNLIIETLGGTSLFVKLDGYVPKGVPGVNDDFRTEADADGFPYGYDLEQAKALLAQEGYDESNPLKITYKYSNAGVNGDVATLLQAMWAQAGVQCEFAAVESGVFYDQLDAGDFEISHYGYSTTLDAMEFLGIWTVDHQIVPAVEDATYDQMINDALALTDPTEYYTALHAAEEYLYDENVYVIPIYTKVGNYLVQTNIEGIETHGGSVYLCYASKN